MTDEKQKQIRSFSGFTIATTVSQVLMMVYSLLLARYFGPEISGGYTAVYSLTSLTSIAFSLGLDNWLLRNAVLSQKPSSALGGVIKIKTISGVIWGVLLFFIAVTVRPDLYSPNLLIICIIDVWFDSVFHSILTIFNVQRKVKKYSLFLIFSRATKLLSLLILIILKDQNILHFAFWRGFTSFIFVVLLLVVFRPDMGRDDEFSFSNVLSQSRSFALSEILATIYMQMDVVILANTRGSTATGIYSPALNLINALFVVPSALYSYFMPSLTKKHETDKQKFVSMSKQVIKILLILGVGLTLGVVVVGKPLANFLLGEKFYESGRLMELMSPILIMKSLEFGFVSIIVAMNKQSDRLLPQTIGALANIGLNIMLIPKYGETGAAFVYLITEAIIFVSYGIIVVKNMKKLRERST